MNARSKLGVAASLIAAVAIAPALAAQEQEGAGMEEQEKKVTVTLESKNDSGITGTAVLAAAPEAESPDAHTVTLELSGLEAGQTYPAHIHGGTCDEGGGVVAALESVAAEAEMASATTTITPDQLAMGETADEPTEMAAEEEEGEEAHGPLFIQVHLPDGTPAACGNVPMMEHEHEG